MMIYIFIPYTTLFCDNIWHIFKKYKSFDAYYWFDRGKIFVIDESVFEVISSKYEVIISSVINTETNMIEYVYMVY